MLQTRPKLSAVKLSKGDQQPLSIGFNYCIPRASVGHCAEADRIQNGNAVEMLECLTATGYSHGKMRSI